MILVAAADAMDDAHRSRFLAVFQDDLAAGGAGGVEHALELQTGNDVGPVSISILRFGLGIELLIARGQNHSANLDFQLFLLLGKIDGPHLTGRRAYFALISKEKNNWLVGEKK